METPPNTTPQKSKPAPARPVKNCADKENHNPYSQLEEIADAPKPPRSN
jgi:hypothetical protein